MSYRKINKEYTKGSLGEHRRPCARLGSRGHYRPWARTEFWTVFGFQRARDYQCVQAGEEF